MRYSKTSILSLLLLSLILPVCSLKAENYAFEKKFENELLVRKIIYEHSSSTFVLYPKTKYEYQYDEQKRVIEMKAFTWSRINEAWVIEYDKIFTYDEHNFAKVKIVFGTEGTPPTPVIPDQE